MLATRNERSDRLRTFLVYALMLAASMLAFTGVLHLGAGLHAPIPSGERFGAGAAHHVNTLMHVLLAMVVIVAAARVCGVVARRLRQPAVVGEVIAGIMLGPSLLGRVAPDWAGFLLPGSATPFLGIIAQIGIILFMFLVGLELDTGLLRKKTHATVAISHASIVAPFLLGSTLALYLYPRLSSSDVPFTVFAMFLGVSISVTAFPVLARILTDRKLQKTRMGVIAISCAAVDDVTAWCLLAFVVSIAQARVGGALMTIGLALGYVLFMILVAGPWIERMVRSQERRGTTSAHTFVAFLGLLLSALLTEWIGIHALFGAFLLGALVPHDSALSAQLSHKLQDFVVIVLLPAFFAFTGLRTQIGLLSSGSDWLLLGLIVLVACAGKFGGSAIAARLTGLEWRDSAALGVLMNTRGLMELIVLNIGLDLRVISPTLFAMLVLMALITTFMTTPILYLLTAPRVLEDRPTAGAPLSLVHGNSPRAPES
jgi:Kef-type K+ transport system membrane component KefB